MNEQKNEVELCKQVETKKRKEKMIHILEKINDITD